MSFLARAIVNIFSTSSACSTPATASMTTSSLTHSQLLSEFFSFSPDTVDKEAPAEDMNMSFVFLTNELEDDIATYSHDTIAELADVCSLAYSELEDNLEADYTVHAFASDLSTGYIRAKSNEVILTYKGTSSCRDLLTDITSFPVVGSPLLPEGGYIHKGFLDAFLSSWPQVLCLLEQHATSQGLRLGQLNITVCGHSLGGAQATLASLQLALLVDKTSQLRQLTFGSPRVVSHAGARYLDRLLGSRTLRVAENDIDPVTMVAPGWWGFKHVGVNLCVTKPAGVLPHLMVGYTAGAANLTAGSFVPTYAVGTRRALFYACRRLLRL